VLLRTQSRPSPSNVVSLGLQPYKLGRSILCILVANEWVAITHWLGGALFTLSIQGMEIWLAVRLAVPLQSACCTPEPRCRILPSSLKQAFHDKRKERRSGVFSYLFRVTNYSDRLVPPPPRSLSPRRGINHSSWRFDEMSGGLGSRTAGIGIECEEAATCNEGCQTFPSKQVPRRPSSSPCGRARGEGERKFRFLIFTPRPWNPAPPDPCSFHSSFSPPRFHLVH